jgi:hypothetical protein
VLRLESPSTSKGLFGIVSSFSSLTGATHNFLRKASDDNWLGLHVDLGEMLFNKELSMRMSGLTYEMKTQIFSISSHSGNYLEPPKLEGAKIRSLTVRGKTCSIEIDETLCLTLGLPRQDSKPEVPAVLQDVRSIYDLAKRHARVVSFGTL